VRDYFDGPTQEEQAEQEEAMIEDTEGRCPDCGMTGPFCECRIPKENPCQ